MKRLIILPLNFLLFSIAYTQNPCLPEGINFNTQEKIDSFQVNYPGCTEIEGNVYIFGSGVQNLNGLFVLQSVGGKLDISATQLTNLEGLNNLSVIGTNFIMANNDSLQTLTGIENLTVIGSMLGIQNNYELLNLEALSSLISVYDLSITYNPKIQSLEGLEGLTTLSGSLAVQGCQSLSSFEGLNNLESVEFLFDFEDNSSIINLVGFSRLKSIGAGIFYNNSSLESFEGLDSLNTVSGYLDIWENPLLEDISSLSNLTYIGGHLLVRDSKLNSLLALDNVIFGENTWLELVGNEQLSTCNASCICEFLSDPYGSVNIWANYTGCDSPEEILLTCLTSTGMFDSSKSIYIYPNPTSTGNITVSWNGNGKNPILICQNYLGQQIIKQELSNKETRIDITTWQAGIYLAKLFEDRKLESVTRFVVQ